jgi:predicted O-linked N-acetylglucosamine transferase (SPINDLY family)
MNIVFLDAIDWDYDVTTPLEHPLGGSQSALCYLAVALARRGNQVTLLSATTRPRVVCGVRCLSLKDAPFSVFRPPCDAVIVLNGPGDYCLRLRPHLSQGTLLVLWTGHAFNQPALHPLARPDARQEWDLIVCVSDWHRSTLVAHFGLEPWRVVVLRNAMAPPFEGLFPDERALVRAKASELILTYTSIPFRGLDLLLSVFPEVHRAYPEAKLHVYSSMKVYQQDERDDPGRPIYERCRSMPEVKYFGSVSQSLLAQALRTATILSYPSTVPETSCIVVMEALAAGLQVVTSDLGALPETTMGFGTLVPVTERDRQQFADRYLSSLRSVLQRWASGAEAFAAEHFQQVQSVNERCTWQRRAVEWEQVIQGYPQSGRQSPGGDKGGAMTPVPAVEIRAAIEAALAHHQAGRLEQAEQIYRRILQSDPTEPNALHYLGLIAHQRGQHEAAAEQIKQALRSNPAHWSAHNNLGLVLLALGKIDEAVACFQEALRLKPDYAEAHTNLRAALGKVAKAVPWMAQVLDRALHYHQRGQLPQAEQLYQQILQAEPQHVAALHLLGVIAYQMGRHDRAIEYIRDALRLQPDLAEAHSNLGNALKAQGKLDEAAVCYRQALHFKPDFADAHGNLGNVLREQGRLDEAVAVLQRALYLNPGFVVAHNNLGIVLKEQGKLEEAVACYRQALRLNPDYVGAYHNLGAALSQQGKLGEAAACYQQALRLQPDSAEAHVNLGSALAMQGKVTEALPCFRQALRLQPDHAGAHSNLGAASKQLGQLQEAVASFQAALRLQPDYAEAHSNLGNALAAQGKIAEAMASYARALSLKPDCAEANSNRLVALHYRAGVTLQELAEAHAEFERQLAAPLRAAWKAHANSPDPDRRLRLGFLSPDLGRHPVGFFVIRLLENLDPDQAAAFCYSNRPTHDEVTARFRAAAMVWREVFGWNAEQLAEQIRADRIDILFDLAGHTGNNQLLVFARKPAPIQVTWAGYVGTTGLQAMDYILADRYEIPPPAEGFYCERVLRMPDGYVCYDPPGYAPAVSALPALEQEYVTFGCFNNPAKISPQIVEIWSRVLKQLPQARLLLKYQGMNDPAVTCRIREPFTEHGIESGRIELSGWSPHPELLAEYQRIDLALDTLPYSGGLSTCEALWMGVPVITCPGETFASRHSLSHLSNIGLKETIAVTPDDYVELAVSLARDLARLAEMRAQLRQQVAVSPLCDGKRFAEEFMRVLRGVWRAWVRHA